MEKIETQIKMIFVVSGKFFLLDELTELVETTPTQSWTIEDEILIPKVVKVRSDKKRIRQNTTWQFSTGFLKTLDFEDVFIQFEKKININTPAFCHYIRENDLKVRIDIVVEIVNEHVPSIHFNQRVIRMCNTLSAEIDIDIYQLRND